jgi:hypothetical protein
VHVVPEEDIKQILHPNERLPLIANKEEKVRIIYDVLEKYIPAENIGITGSFLCGLNQPQSDIDFVVYGRRNFDIARCVMKNVEKEGIGIITRMNDASEIWRRIYAKRKPEMEYDEFVVHEMRKNNRGMIGNSYFDILYVRDWAELVHLDRRNYEIGEKIGYGKIIGEVKDATFSFDSPAIYEVEVEAEHSLMKVSERVSKVLSFTHTYAGQALKGEKIEARGMIERTKHETRLVVGTTREAKGEWIKSLTLLCND